MNTSPALSYLRVFVVLLSPRETSLVAMQKAGGPSRACHEFTQPREHGTHNGSGSKCTGAFSQLFFRASSILHNHNNNDARPATERKRERECGCCVNMPGPTGFSGPGKFSIMNSSRLERFLFISLSPCPHLFALIPAISLTPGTKIDRRQVFSGKTAYLNGYQVTKTRRRALIESSLRFFFCLIRRDHRIDERLGTMRGVEAFHAFLVSQQHETVPEMKKPAP